MNALHGRLALIQTALAIATLAGCGALIGNEPIDYDASGGLAGDAGTRADAAGSGGQCVSGEPAIERAPLIVTFAVEYSIHMNRGGRWTAARDALLGALEELRSEPALFVGAARSTGVGEATTSVEIGALSEGAHYDRVVALFDLPTASGTASTLQLLRGAYLTTQNVDVDRDARERVADTPRSAVVYVGGGVPLGGAAEARACESEARASREGLAMPTYVIGVGEDGPSEETLGPVFLSRLAAAGGTGLPGCDGVLPESPSRYCHRVIAPTVAQGETKKVVLDLVAAMRAFPPGTCRYTLAANALSSLGTLEVVMTSATGSATVVPNDPVDGWSLDDAARPNELLLHGAACAATASSRVDAFVKCRDQ